MEALDRKPVKNKIVKLVIPMREKVFIHRALWSLDYTGSLSEAIRDILARHIQEASIPPFTEVNLTELKEYENSLAYLCFMVSEDEKASIKEAKKFKARSEQEFILGVLRQVLYYRLDENKDIVRVKPPDEI